MQMRDRPVGVQTLLSLLDWAARNHVGDASGLLGLCISLIGFGATLWGVYKSRNAAEAARIAAEQARAHLLSFEASTRLARIISQLDLLRRLQREGDWTTLIDRYAD